MSDSNDVQLSAGMNATGIEKGVEQGKAAVRDLAAEAQKQGAAASKGLDGIGKSGTESAATLDRATRSIAGSIERASAAMRARDGSKASYLEELAKQRGADLTVLAPLLQELRDLEAARKGATSSLDGIGASARQTAAALRGVPAQFTDIVTSISSGQAPLTVFLQQGGQLKDMFGGVGNAARALGGYVAGLVNPYTIAAGAAAGLVLAYKAGAEEASAFQRALILSGEAAGVTAGRLTDIAAGVAAIGAGTQGRAAEILAQLAQSASVGASNMERFTAAAIRFEQVGGPAAEETAKAFADLAKAPLEGSLKLNQATNFLTQSTYEQIKALEEQGRTVEAARVAQESYASAIETRTPQMVQSLGYVESAWLGIKNVAKKALDDILSVGRSLGTDQAAAALRNRIASVEAGNEGRAGRSQLPALQAQLAAMEQGAKYEALSAFYEAERAASVKARVDYDKVAGQYLSREEQAKKEIRRIEELSLAAGIKRKDVEILIAQVREKYADKPAGGIKADAFMAERDAAKDWAKAYQAFGDAIAEAEGKTGQLTRSQVELIKYLQSPAYQLMGEPASQLALQQAYAAISAEQLNDASKEYAKSLAEANRSYQQWITDLGRGAAEAQKEVERLQTEAEAAELAALGYYSLAQAVQVVQVAKLKAQQDALLGDNVATDAIQAEIDARQRLVEQLQGKEAREAAARSAKDAADEWQKYSDQISQSLTDALLRGFEAGKDFATTFRDTLVNMFKTLVLRPVIQWAVQPVQQLVGNFLGMGPTVAPSGQIVSGNTLSSAANVFSLGRNLTAGFSGLSLGVANASSVTSANLAGTGLDGMLAANGAYGTAGTGAGWAGTLGSAAGIGAGVLGGVYGGRAISGGYSVNGGSGNSAVNTGTAIGAAVGSIVPVLGTALGALIGGLVGGAANRLFGRKAPEVTDQGITGTIGGGDFSGSVFRDVLQKGGMFRSDKRYTEMTALPDDLGNYLDKASKTLFDQVTELGKTLGLPVQQLAGISSKIRITLSADAEKNQQAITEVLKTYTDDLVLPFKAQLEPLRQYGESLDQTLSRLSVLQTFSESLNQLGGVFGDVSRLSLSTRQAFVDMSGGLESLATKAQAFAQNYYQRDEIAGLKARELQSVLAGAGVNADQVASRDDFRRLVEATDVSTETGRAQLAALLDVAGAFTDVADYLAETGTTLAKAAAQAPVSGPVANLIAPTVNVDSTEQVVAINGVQSSVDRVGGLLAQLVDLVRTGSRSGFSLEVFKP